MQSNATSSGQSCVASIVGMLIAMTPLRASILCALLASTVSSLAWAAPAQFEDPLIAFEDPLIAFEDPLIAFEDPLIAFEDPLIAFANPMATFEDPLIAFDHQLLGYGASLELLALTCERYAGIDGNAKVSAALRTAAGHRVRTELDAALSRGQAAKEALGEAGHTARAKLLGQDLGALAALRKAWDKRGTPTLQTTHSAAAAAFVHAKQVADGASLAHFGAKTLALAVHAEIVRADALAAKGTKCTYCTGSLAHFVSAREKLVGPSLSSLALGPKKRSATEILGDVARQIADAGSSKQLNARHTLRQARKSLQFLVDGLGH